MGDKVVTRRLIEKRTRGVIGWLFLILFWGFNALMGFGLIHALSNLGEAPAGYTKQLKDAHQAGQALGVLLY